LLRLITLENKLYHTALFVHRT